jgi:hypothetical protein
MAFGESGGDDGVMDHRHEVDLFHSHGAAATLTHHGPAGWLTLGAAAAILAMPALTATPPGSPRPRPAPGPCTTPSASACNGDGASPAPATSPPPSPRSPASASRNPALSPATCTAPGAGLPSFPVMASSALALSPLPRAPAASSPLGPGATWDPSHQLRHATRRATFVHVDSTALHQILTPSPAGT